MARRVVQRLERNEITIVQAFEILQHRFDAGMIISLLSSDGQ